MHLQPLELWFLPTAGPLLPQVRAALSEYARTVGGTAGDVAEPLRWAITAVEARRGLRIEGVLVVAPGLPLVPAAEAG